ncbi:MAG: putative glycosyl transferase [Candidatus Scalindua rubra]|uniref:Putative glycosyl transferase n=1 Tax=Candidatus Scalindua rubra TaxID=1872076 RepID=A0A1E3X6N8_9BACT|nr:MAG: putative glycosyl transferase [Candidatus Scalindua rubra]
MISKKRNVNPFVSIIIPTLNRKRDIIKCLHFLRRLEYPKKHMEVIIWDNGSMDGTQAEVNRIFKEMEKDGWKGLNMIQSEENLGGFTSRDELFKRIDTNADYVLNIDDDVFLSSDSLTILMRTLQDHSEAGIIGPRTVYEWKPDETAHGAGFVNLWLGRYGEIDAISLIECDYVIGCCMLIKSEVVSKLKGFDRDYYTSHGEVDFCLRARKKGYKIFYDPGVVVRHNVARGGTKTLERIYYLYRNKLVVIRKNATLLQKVTSLSLYTIFWVPKMIMDSMWFHRGIKLDEWLVMLKAVRHAIINRVGKVDI